MLWVMGGNPFNLREAIESSGFNTVIADVVQDGVVFAGESAGACIAGTDLHGVELVDDPEYAEHIIWDALNLSSHYFLPHADNESMRPAMEQLLAVHKNNPQTVILNDNQVWIENNDEGRIITGAKPPANME